MPENFRLPSNLSPAFSVCNSYENQAVPFLGHFKINWHRTHAFSQTTLLLVGVAFAFFMNLPLVLIGIVGFANMHMIIHFAQEKRKYFPFFEDLEVNWNRLQFFSHSIFVLSGIAFTFFLHLTPIMMGLTVYGSAQVFLYIKEEKNIEVPFLDQMDIKWQSVQFKTNIFLFISGIAATYLLQMPFLLMGLAGFGLTQRILYETNKEALSKKVQLHWDKIALVENGGTLLGGFGIAAYLGFPIIMLVLSIYGATQMIFFNIAHKKPINYALQERKVQSLNDQESKLQATKHDLELQNDKLMKSLLAIKVDEGIAKEKVRELKEQQSRLSGVVSGVEKTYRKLKEKQANLEGIVKQLEKNRTELLKKGTVIDTVERNKWKLQQEVQDLKYQIDLLQVEKESKGQNLQRIRKEESELNKKVQERERILESIPEELELLEEQRDELKVFQETLLGTCKDNLNYVKECSADTINMMSKKVEEYAQTISRMREETNTAKLAIVSSSNEHFRKESEATLQNLEQYKELLVELVESIREEAEKQEKQQAMFEQMLEKGTWNQNTGRNSIHFFPDTKRKSQRTRGSSLSSSGDLKALAFSSSSTNTNPITKRSSYYEPSSSKHSLTKQQQKKALKELEENENATRSNSRNSVTLIPLKQSSETVSSSSSFVHTDPDEIKKIEKLVEEDKKKTSTFYGTG